MIKLTRSNFWDKRQFNRVLEQMVLIVKIMNKWLNSLI